MNKFCNATKNTKDIEFINSICNRQSPKDFTILYLFYINELVQKHNENVFINTLSPMFIFKTMDINHQSCPPFYKLSNDLSKIASLHSTININIYMLVELCVGNYVTSDGLVNGINDIFKTSTTYCEKIIIWIMFHNSKIITLTREKYNHYYDNNIESKWTPIEPIVKDIRVGKSQSFIIIRIQFSIQLATIRTIHYS